MRRRSKPGVWLPPSPDSRVVGSLLVPSQSAIGTANIPPVSGGAGSSSAASVALVGDYNEESIAGNLGTTLADEIQGGYRLRRVVGKIFVACRQVPDDESPSNPTSLIAWAGIIVRRVNSAGDPVSTSVFADAYENQRDPYLWRRDWALTNYLAQGAAVTKVYSFPTQNVDYGSVMDGPHVDAKTKRFVGAEERLYMDVGFTYIDGTGEAINGPQIDVWWDLRFFAFMAPAGQGNRRNASR